MNNYHILRVTTIVPMTFQAKFEQVLGSTWNLNHPYYEARNRSLNWWPGCSSLTVTTEQVCKISQTFSTVWNHQIFQAYIQFATRNIFHTANFNNWAIFSLRDTFHGVWSHEKLYVSLWFHVWVPILKRT